MKAQEKVGFVPLLAFPDFQGDYESDDLFPLFKNRVISHKRSDEELRILVELNNPATRLAVPLLTEDYQMIGWAPRYLVEDLINCVPNAPELSAKIARINAKPAPLNQRILIDYAGRSPQGTQPMSTPDFKPLMD